MGTGGAALYADDTACMQVSVGDPLGDMAVFVADCEYNRVRLEWLDDVTLQITFPSTANVPWYEPSVCYRGRTTRLLYAMHSD